MQALLCSMTAHLFGLSRQHTLNCHHLVLLVLQIGRELPDMADGCGNVLAQQLPCVWHWGTRIQNQEAQVPVLPLLQAHYRAAVTCRRTRGEERWNVKTRQREIMTLHNNSILWRFTTLLKCKSEGRVEDQPSQRGGSFYLFYLINFVHIMLNKWML